MFKLFVVSMIMSVLISSLTSVSAVASNSSCIMLTSVTQNIEDMEYSLQEISSEGVPLEELAINGYLDEYFTLLEIEDALIHDCLEGNL